MKLIPELHITLLDENKCLYCRKVGHFIPACNEKRAGDARNSTLRIAATMVMNNLEEIPEKDHASE
jgi:hypothetical protein